MRDAFNPETFVPKHHLDLLSIVSTYMTALKLFEQHHEGRKVSEISASDFRANMAECINQVYYGNQEFTLTRHGSPVAKVVHSEVGQALSLHNQALNEFNNIAGIVDGEVTHGNYPQVHAAFSSCLDELLYES